METSQDGRAFPFDLVVASPNAALDSYYLLAQLQPGAVNRAETVFHTAGGKGNNLARSVRMLGGRVLSLGIVGGHSGRFIAAELAREEIPCDLVWVGQETRRSSTIINPAAMQTTVVLDSGIYMAPQEGERLAEMICSHTQDAPFIVLTGSLPPGLCSSYYAEIIQKVKSGSAAPKVCLDCSGEALLSAAESGASIIKVNASEYQLGLAPKSEPSPRRSQRTFESLQGKGLDLLIVTDGPHGAYVYSANRPPFQVITEVNKWVSTAGAGDTFMAGLLLSLNLAKSIEEAAAFACASAAASLQQVVCGNLDPLDVDHFLGLTEIHALPL